MFGYLKIYQKVVIVLIFMVKNYFKCINYIFCFFRGIFEEFYIVLEWEGILIVQDFVVFLGYNFEISFYLILV